MGRVWRTLLVLVVVAVVLAVAGCGAPANRVEVAPGVTVDQGGGGKVTITGPDGSTTTSGENKLPDGFPTDVPIYQPSTVSVGSVSNIEGGKVFNVLLESTAATADVWSWYGSQVPAQGWSVKTTMKSEDGGLITGEKGSQNLTIGIGKGSGDTGTDVSIAVAPIQ